MPRLLTHSSGPLTPEDIVRRARAGDSAGIAALYDSYAGALFRTAYRLSGSCADAEDIVHDLFVGLPDALRRYDDRGHLGAWLTRVVVRLTLMRARTDRRRRAAPLEDALGLAASDRTDARVDLTELQQAVIALPEALRVVFVLKQVEGYSHDEIGTLLRISTGASRARLTRALEKLRCLLR